jgi:general secretion pathway protein F
MATYSYTAFDIDGNKKKGFITADNERLARAELKKLNLKTQAIKLSNKDFSAKIKINDKDLSIATRQLATLLDANLSINDALKITADQLNNKKLSEVLYILREDIIQGKRLANSMKKYNKIFSNTYISLVSAGDSSGNLSKIFNDLADYLEDSLITKQKITSALTYPIILFTFSILVIVGLLNFVLPTVVDQFTRSGTELPGLTSFLLLISNNIVLIILVLGLVLTSSYVTYRNFIKKPNNHVDAHYKFLRIPLIGKFILFVQLERYTKTMSLLLASGVNLDKAMIDGQIVITNKYIEDKLIDIQKNVIEGKDFALAIQKIQIFPDIFKQLISSGYRSGNLSKMFLKTSDYLKSEIESKRNIFLSLLDPFVIIFMGGFIMMIVLAILIPIMQMNTLTLG